MSQQSNHKYDMFDSTLMVEKLSKFSQIINSTLPQKVVEIDELLKTKFNSRNIQQCLIGEEEIAKRISKVHSREEVDEYRHLYRCTVDRGELFLLPNGMFPANHTLIELADFLADQYETFYVSISECLLTLELMLPPFENRNVFEHSLLTETLQCFRDLELSVTDYHNKLYRICSDSRGSCAWKVGKRPQYEDLRKNLVCREKGTMWDLITMEYRLLASHLYILDVVTKNGAYLGEYMKKTYLHHSRRLKKGG